MPMDDTLKQLLSEIVAAHREIERLAAENARLAQEHAAAQQLLADAARRAASPGTEEAQPIPPQPIVPPAADPAGAPV